MLMAKIQRSRKQRCKLRSLPRKIVKTDASGAITLDDHGHATNAKSFRLIYHEKCFNDFMCIIIDDCNFRFYG